MPLDQRLRSRLFSMLSGRIYSKTRDRAGCLKVHGLDSPHAPWWVYPPTIVGDGARCRNRRMNRDAESVGRDALTSAVRAFNLLEDMPEADDAHRLIHEIGMYVSRHFGCKINLRDGLWRLGVSSYYRSPASWAVRRLHRASHLLNMSTEYYVRPVFAPSEPDIRGSGSRCEPLSVRNK